MASMAKIQIIGNVGRDPEMRMTPGGKPVCDFSVAVNRVSRRDYTDSLLFDQIDGGAAFTVLAHPERPVHYKFHQPVVIRYERVSGGIRADVVEVQQAAGRRRPSA